MKTSVWESWHVIGLPMTLFNNKTSIELLRKVRAGGMMVQFLNSAFVY